MKNWIFLLCLLLGCSTSEKDLDAIKGQETSPDLVKQFELKGDEFKKFEEKEIPAKKVESTDKVVVSKEQKATTPKESKSKVAEKNIVVGTEFAYPTNYPEDYKKLDKKSEKYWSNIKVPYKVGEQMVFDVKYFGITAGQVALTVQPNKIIGDKTVNHFHVKMKSAPFYKMIYEVNDYLDSYVDAEKFLPIKYMVIQRESKQDVDDLQLFDNDKLLTHYRYKRVKKKDNSVKNEADSKFIPRFYQDSFSVLYFMRCMNLKVGDSYEFPVITRAKPWLIKVHIPRIEKVETKLGVREAFRLNTETQYPGVLKANGEAIFWISADDKKQILKFQAKVKLGSIDGELVDLVDGK
jgi:hypothetical protein